jgi:transketolase
MPIENIHDKWTSFGWDVIEMNGNDVNDIVRTFDQIDYDNGKPHLVISHTTKGLGVSFMENVAKWHHGVPKDEQYAQALREVKKRIAKAEME